MRIIRQGSIPVEMARVTCRECKTLFEFVKSEGKLVPDFRDGDYVEINCPFCHKTLAVSVGLFRKE